MIAVEIRDWALAWSPERNVVEGMVELAVDTSELIERGADLPRHLTVIARCGMRGCDALADVWLEPLFARPEGSPLDATALEVPIPLYGALADWRLKTSSLYVRLERERYRQARQLEEVAP